MSLVAIFYSICGNFVSGTGTTEIWFHLAIKINLPVLASTLSPQIQKNNKCMQMMLSVQVWGERVKMSIN
jgi:hypothetical protein